MKLEKNSKDFLKMLLIILATILIVAIAVGFGLRQKGNNNAQNPGDGKSDIKPVPVQEKIIVPKVIYNLSGRITKIDGNTIVFNAEIHNVDEKGVITGREEERRAIVNSHTKISRLSFVDRSPVKKEIDLGALKSGDYVDIISGSDISKAEEFLASQVTVKPSK